MRARKSAVVLVLVGVLVSIVLSGAVSTGRAAAPAITFTLAGSPSSVTQGQNVGYGGTVTNAGPQTATHLTLVENVPNGTPLFTSFSRPVTCGPVTGGVLTCDLGNLAAGDSITFTKVYRAPSSGSSLVDTSYVTFDERGSDTNKSKQDTRCANTGTDKPCAPSVSTALVASSNSNFYGGYVGYGGQGATVGTDPTLSHTNSDSTQAAIPFRSSFANGVPVTILERPESFPGEDCATSFTCAGLVHDVTVTGGFSLSAPLVLTFGLGPDSIPHGATPATLNVFHDGSGPLPRCSATPLSTASPICVQSVTQDLAGNFIVVVQTLTNGGWRFG